MSFNSITYNVTALLGRTSFPSSNYSTKPIIIPPFQRGYSWEKSHIATFWDDVIAFHNQLDLRDATENYFLGPIVILPKTENVELLDGQQRLATITILLSVMRDKARTLGHAGGDLARDIHRDHIVIDEDEENYALTLGELDNPYFRITIQNDPPNEREKARLRSHRLILQVKSFLKRQIENLIDNHSAQEKIRVLKKLVRTISTRLKFVSIEVKSEEEAFLIFETLNDRGLRLAVPDLVLNHLMRIADSSDARTRIRTHWNSVVENLGQRKVSTFVRHMWVSRYGDVKSQGLYREIRDNLAEQDINSLDFAALCAEESESYIALTGPIEEKLPNGSFQYVKALQKNLSGDRTLPILLSGIICLDQNDFVRLASATLTLVVRHSIFANLNPSDLEDKLYNAARAIRTAKENGETSRSAFTNAKQILSEINPTRAQITNGIRDLYLTKQQANYVVHAIANYMQDPQGTFNLNDNSIEHIFPENANETDWPNYNDLESMEWHIGNLTILEPNLNRSAGNQGFTTKLQYYDQSAIAMTNKINTDYRTWDSQQVQNRALSFLPTIRLIWSETL